MFGWYVLFIHPLLGEILLIFLVLFLGVELTSSNSIK